MSEKDLDFGGVFFIGFLFGGGFVIVIFILMSSSTREKEEKKKKRMERKLREKKIRDEKRISSLKSEHRKEIDIMRSDNLKEINTLKRAVSYKEETLEILREQSNTNKYIGMKERKKAKRILENERKKAKLNLENERRKVEECKSTMKVSKKRIEELERNKEKNSETVSEKNEEIESLRRSVKRLEHEIQEQRKVTIARDTSEKSSNNLYKGLSLLLISSKSQIFDMENENEKNQVTREMILEQQNSHTNDKLDSYMTDVRTNLLKYQVLSVKNNYDLLESCPQLIEFLQKIQREVQNLSFSDVNKHFEFCESSFRKLKKLKMFHSQYGDFMEKVTDLRRHLEIFGILRTKPVLPPSAPPGVSKTGKIREDVFDGDDEEDEIMTLSSDGNEDVFFEMKEMEEEEGNSICETKKKKRMTSSTNDDLKRASAPSLPRDINEDHQIPTDLVQYPDLPNSEIVLEEETEGEGNDEDQDYYENSFLQELENYLKSEDFCSKGRRRVNFIPRFEQQYNVITAKLTELKKSLKKIKECATQGEPIDQFVFVKNGMKQICDVSDDFNRKFLKLDKSYRSIRIFLKGLRTDLCKLRNYTSRSSKGRKEVWTLEYDIARRYQEWEEIDKNLRFLDNDKLNTMKKLADNFKMMTFLKKSDPLLTHLKKQKRFISRSIKESDFHRIINENIRTNVKLSQTYVFHHSSADKDEETWQHLTFLFEQQLQNIHRKYKVIEEYIEGLECRISISFARKRVRRLYYNHRGTEKREVDYFGFVVLLKNNLVLPHFFGKEFDSDSRKLLFVGMYSDGLIHGKGVSCFVPGKKSSGCFESHSDGHIKEIDPFDTMIEPFNDVGLFTDVEVNKVMDIVSDTKMTSRKWKRILISGKGMMDQDTSSDKEEVLMKKKKNNHDQNQEMIGKLWRENEELKKVRDEKKCKICFDRDKNTLCLPCKHFCMCKECSVKIREDKNKCPICRENIESVVVMFL